jgi:transposase-like protein
VSKPKKGGTKMTENIMTLIDELRKTGLHEDLEFCKKAAEYLAQQAIELEAEEVIGAKKYERTEARTKRNLHHLTRH